MHTNLRILLYCFILSLAACHPERTLNKELQIASSMIEEHPDTALYVLQQISEPERMNEEEYATYCLLRTQAEELTRTPYTSEAMITAAVVYFKEKNNPLPKAKSYYYLAKVNESLEKEALAEQNYLQAIASIEKTKEYKLTGLIYTHLSELYVKLNRYTEAHDMQQKAYSNYLLASNKETGFPWYLYAAPMLLIGVLLLVAVRYKQKWNKKEKQTEKQEKQLAVAQQTILEYMQTISVQKMELTGLKKELKATKRFIYNSSDIIRKIQAFNSLSITSKEKPALTEQEWKSFLSLLEETYGFVSSLQQTYPKLTDIDIRICALLKEKISITHISTIMCMIPETLAKRMQRIKGEKMGQAGSKSSLEMIVSGF